MSATDANDSHLELAHVLFIDIVGYSKRLINEQTALVKRLNELVLQTEQCQKADAAGKLIRIPTGDGMALAFFTSPDAPVRCAMELSKADQADPKLELRMGIHTGPVDQVSDVNQRSNVAGAGINMAQRVMDCGDAGHILLSKHVAEDLEQYGHWQPLLHDLGTCEVKHRARLGVVNLYGGGIGNPQLPKKFQALKKQRSRIRWTGITAALLAVAAIASAFVILSKRLTRSTSTILEKSVAVLPFENLSDDKANAYFADGIQDEILTKLASIADLKVISRTSTAKYKSKPEDLKTVSQQLGVANVLEGTVQRAIDKVRVNVQLIDARADSHLWAKSYDRDIKDVFAVESEVSQEIADALQAKLSPKETNDLATAPTKDSEAYDMFLKGEYEQHAAESSLKGEGFDRAAAFYEQAIARDPNFALAVARRVMSLSKRYHWGDSPSETELSELKASADRAVTMAPDLAEAHVARGLFYYYGAFQYDHALTDFQRAVELQPNHARALSYLAAIHDRQGQRESSLAELKKCQELDPRDPAIPNSIGGIYLDWRMWEEARRNGQHALALDAHNVAGMHIVFFSGLNETGDINEAKRILEAFPQDNESFGFIPGGVLALINLNAYICVLERDFNAAYKTWGDETSNPTTNRVRLCARAVLHVLSGDAPGAQAEIEKARGLVEAKLREQPQDVDSMIQLSWINLGLSRNDEALKLVRKAVEVVPIQTDMVAGTFVLAASAEIQARAGQPAEAIKTLHQLLSMPAGLQASIQRLKIDPVWDPIRNEPDFQQLLAGKELVGPNK